MSDTAAQCPITVDAGEDVWLCQVPGSAKLNGSITGNYLSFNWSPTTGMQGANTLSPTVTVNGPATFVLTGRSVNLNNNLIVNGDFEGGNFGFSSSYVYSPTNLVPEGTYAVLPNPQTAHPGFAPCGDHTSGGGNMMAVNGAGTPNQNVWCQTVAIQPNTQYVFSAWVTSLHPSSPARLQFSINGNPIGPIFTAPSTTCTWLNFYTTWNSGSNTSATICIVNQNTTLGGNDFAIDDIVFSPVCTVSDTVQVHVVQLQAVAAPAISVIPCEGSPIVLNGNGSSTGQHITYRWETANGNIVSGETTLQPVVNSAGSYTLVVTFNNGWVECTRTATANVIPSNNPLTAWISPPQPLGCGNGVVSLRGFTNQPAFARYAWTAGPGGNFTSKADSAVVWVNRPGQYTLTVTNTMTGCTAQASVTVIAATEVPSARAEAGLSAYYCTSDTFSLNGSGSSTGLNYTYAWTALLGGRIVRGADSIRALANAPGRYVLQVTNTANGCIARDTVTVEDRRILPAVSVDTPDVFTCTTDTVWLSGRVDSGAVRIVWRSLDGLSFAGDSTGRRIGALAPGVYVLVAVDTVNACSVIDTTVVSADTVRPEVYIAPPDLLTCSRPEVILSAEGSFVGEDFAYAWTAIGGGNIVGVDTLPTVRVNAPGAYSLLVTYRKNGCTAVAETTVAADSGVLIAIANAPEVLTCARTAVGLNADGSSSLSGLQYAWTTADGLILSGANTPYPEVGAPGTYTLVLTNPANGCTAYDIAVVQQDTQAPLIRIAAPGAFTCQRRELFLLGENASGGSSFVYYWTASDGGNIASGAEALTPLINAAGTYTLTALNAINGCTAIASVAVSTDTSAPIAYISPALPLTCSQPERTLDATASSSGPGFAFVWAATRDGHFVADTGTLSPAIDAAGTYMLTVTNLVNGCTAIASIEVGIDTLRPSADAGSDGRITCAQPSYRLLANGGQADGHAYLWRATEGSITGDSTAQAIDVQQEGIYIVEVTNPQNGCRSSDTVRVVADRQPPEPLIEMSHSAITCLHPQVFTRISNISPGWKARWTTAMGNILSSTDSSLIWVDAAGEYSLLVVDLHNGCTNIQNVTVGIDTTAPQVSILPPELLTCAKQEVLLQAVVDPDTGIVFSWASTGIGPLPQWATLTPTTPIADRYILHVTRQGNGCSAVAQIDVYEERSKPFVDAGKDTVLSCLYSQIALSGKAEGLRPPVVLWKASGGGHIVAGADTYHPLVDAPGIYTLIATDPFNGCADSSSVVVEADQGAPQASIALPDTLTCARRQMVLRASVHPVALVSVSWSATAGGRIVAGADGPTPTVDAAGHYALTVLNTQNGCTATAEVWVRQDTSSPVVSVLTPSPLTCDSTRVSLQALPDSATFGYEWKTTEGRVVSNPAAARVDVDRPGLYTLTVTDPRTGCARQQMATVNEDVTTPQITLATPPVLTCAAPQATLQATVQLAPPDAVQVRWSSFDGNVATGSHGLSPTVTAPGTYTLWVKNAANGCTAEASVTVGRDTTAPIARLQVPPPITCRQPTISLEAAGSTGKGALSFSWAGPALLSGQGTPTPLVGQGGTYTLTLTDAANGCTAVAAAVVSADTATPKAHIAPTLPLTCVRESVLLNASASTGQAPLTALWSTPDGRILSGQNTLTAEVDAPGLYTLLLTNGLNGCTASAAVKVYEDRTPPEASAGPDQILYCSQPEVTLAGSSATAAPVTFSWSVVNGGPLSGSPDQALTFTRSPGTYRLTVTRLSNGCTASDEVSVSKVDLPKFSFYVAQPNCHNNTGQVRFTSVSDGRPPFQYSVDGGRLFRPTPHFSALTAGAYTLVVSDALGCTASAIAAVEPALIPKIFFSKIAPVPLGDSVRLEPSLNVPFNRVADWQWTPTDGLSCDDCPAPWAAPVRSTRYHLRILDVDGCPAEAYVTVPVSRRRLLYIPNIFSPDGDGQNDRFTLYGNRGVLSIRSLQVFDRWGSLVFSARDLRPGDESAGWDGTFRGQPALPGVYVWQALVSFLDGEEEMFAGDVTVYR